MRKILGKKGFTLLELVVVVAIIGVLTAMIVPSLSTAEQRKKAAVSGAKDFYSAAQYLVTKYSRYEGFLSNDMMKQQKGEDAQNLKSDSILLYDKTLFGNYPPHDYVMISMAVRHSEIAYVNAVCADTPAECEEKIFKQEGLTVVDGKYQMTPFERVFLQDIDPLFEQQDGIYYVTIKAEGYKNVSLDSATNPSMRVVLTGFSSDELPIATGEFNKYQTGVLLFSEDFRLANGFFMGVCSSLKNKGTGNYVGVPGSYFTAVAA